MRSMEPTDGAKQVWLTFDDGPHPEHSKRILDTLRAEEIKATFFVIGRNVRRHGLALLERARDEGHRIGNHSFSHPNLTSLNPDQIRDEIMKAHEIISRFLDDDDPLFRPPYGASNTRVEAIVAELGYRAVLWDVDTRDWDRANQPDGWIERGIDRIRDRTEARVLAHDIQETTADHLPMFISEIRALGNVTFEPPSTL